MHAYYIIGSNEDDCSCSHDSSSYGYTCINRWNACSQFNIYGTDNKTDAGTGGGNGSSSIEATDGRPGNSESAKSGINTTVCGPDTAHACQTSSGGQ